MPPVPAELADTARFRPTDAEPVVAASFTCPCCLQIDADVTGRLFAEDIDDVTLHCGCRSCGTAWTVGVDAGQLLRLVLHPPASTGFGWRLSVELR